MKTTERLIRFYSLKLIMIVVLIIFSSVQCSSQTREEKNLEILDLILKTMDEGYFDPAYDGLDWKNITDNYRPIIKACKSNDSLYYHLNKMLFRLGVSHLGVASPEEVNEISDPQLMLDGAAGLDVMYLNEKAVIVKVSPYSPASEMNLKPGFEIIQLNNKTIKEIADKRTTEPTPPFNERNIVMMINSDIVRELYGTPGKTISIVYLDSKNEKHSINLPLKERNQTKAFILPNMPKIYASVDSRIIDGKIGYIHFDVFHPAILDTILQIIKSYNELPCMILDIRDNPGGEFGTRKRIAEQFISSRTLFWKYQSRNRIDDVYLEPAEKPYKGDLVVLINERSSSSSEEFSGGMKAIDRATIIGKQTAGKVLTMKAISLPEGALFVYPNRKTMTSKNEVLEGAGVVPDITVELNAKDLLEGKDSQLETAVKYFTYRR